MRSGPESTTPDHALRILVVDPAPRGGLVHHSWVTCDALADHAEVTLLAVAPYELADVPRRFDVRSRLRSWPKRSDGALLHRLWSAAIALAVVLRNWAVILRACRRLRPDVVQFQNTPTNHPSGVWWRSPYLDLGLLRVVRRFGAAVVAMIHDVPVGPRTSGTSALIRATDGVISHRPLDEIPGIGGIPVAIVPHPPYKLIADLGARDRSDFVAALASDGRLVVHPGHLEAYKGTDTVIEAFDALADQFPDVRLVVAGQESEPAFAMRLKELILRSRHAKRIVYEPRFLPISELGALLRAADVVALPYRSMHKHAASGIAYAAVASGARVVASSDGSFDDLQQHRALTIVPPDDPSALASAIADSLRRGPVAAQTADTWADAVRELLALYAAALDTRARRR